MEDIDPFARECAGCGHETDDWVMVNAYYVAKGTVALCWDCERREKDYRLEKGE